MLHDIFIGKSIAERMEIIGTDRRILQARLAKEAAIRATITVSSASAVSSSPALLSARQRQKRLSKLATVTL